MVWELQKKKESDNEVMERSFISGETCWRDKEIWEKLREEEEDRKIRKTWKSD